MWELQVKVLLNSKLRLSPLPTYGTEKFQAACVAKGRHDDRDKKKAGTNYRSQKVSRFWDTSSVPR